MSSPTQAELPTPAFPSWDNLTAPILEKRIDFDEIRKGLLRITPATGEREGPPLTFKQQQEKTPLDHRSILAELINQWARNFGNSISSLDYSRFPRLGNSLVRQIISGSLSSAGFVSATADGFQITREGFEFAFKDSFTSGQLATDARLMNLDKSSGDIDHNSTFALLFALSRLPALPATECLEKLQTVLGWEHGTRTASGWESWAVLDKVKELLRDKVIELSNPDNKAAACIRITEGGAITLKRIAEQWSSRRDVQETKAALVRQQIMEGIRFISDKFNLEEGVRFLEIRSLLLHNSGNDITESMLDTLVRSQQLIKELYSPVKVARISVPTLLYRVTAEESLFSKNDYKIPESLLELFQEVDPTKFKCMTFGKQIEIDIDILERALRQRGGSDVIVPLIQSVLLETGIENADKGQLAYRVKAELIKREILLPDGKRRYGHQKKYSLRPES